MPHIYLKHFFFLRNLKHRTAGVEPYEVAIRCPCIKVHRGPLEQGMGGGEIVYKITGAVYNENYVTLCQIADDCTCRRCPTCASCRDMQYF